MFILIKTRRQIVCKVGNPISGKEVSKTRFIPGHMFTDDAKDKYGESGALFYFCFASGRMQERIIP
jgi:hypothetical protein